MAKIKMSGIGVVDIRGKLNGTVFSKNRGGAYVRTKVTPSNPQTSAQMAIRGIFASISSAWSSLTQSARDTFNGFVSAYATTDIFGDIRNPSGKALFQKLNQNLEVSGQVQITTCVAPSEVPFANLNNAQGTVSTSVFNVDTAGDTTGSVILVFATPMLSQGTTFVKNKLRLVKVVTGGAAIVDNIQDDYVVMFGAPVAGANIYVAVKVINANGQASPIETAKSVIFAT